MQTPWIARVFVATGLAATSSVVAEAQPAKTHQAEFALLQSINFVSQRVDRYYGDPAGEEDRHFVALTFPSYTPGTRITFWGERPLLIEFGLSLLRVDQEARYTSDMLLQIETGVGADFGRTGRRTRPFIGLLGGVLSTTEGSDATEAYLGGQVGLRRFIRDYAALRFQLGYRRTLGDKFKLKALEIAAGISFFI